METQAVAFADPFATAFGETAPSLGQGIVATAARLNGQAGRPGHEQARLLVIDDEPVNALVLEKALRQAGYRQVIVHTDSVTAFETIAAQRPHLVLCDVGMPVSGMSVLRKVVEDPALVHTAMIMMTASDDESLRTEALELGATDLLSKPLKQSELLPRVRNSLLLRSHVTSLQAHNQELERKVRRRTAELLASRNELVNCLARLAEFRDNETGRHVIRVGRYSGLIARELGLDAETAELIEQAAPLHDIGKIGIPDSILLKPGRLSLDEFEIMKRHVSIGKATFEPMSPQEQRALRSHTILGEMLIDSGSSPLLAMAAEIALTHHERWDGQGYPIGLQGEEIPVCGRVVAVADVFDALTNKRPYKPPFSIEKSFQILQEGSGSQFDPQAVEAFQRVREQVVQVRIDLADID